MNKKESFRKTLILIQVGIAFSFLKSLSVSAQSCLTGYFSQNGVCTKCATSCYTCTNATECETCYNKILNNSTKLCEFCPYGQFYSDQVDMCIDCKGSCRNECGYQSECYINLKTPEGGRKVEKIIMKCKMKSSAWFEPVPAPSPTPAPYQTLQTKSLFANEKLKILNLIFCISKRYYDFSLKISKHCFGFLKQIKEKVYRI